MIAYTGARRLARGAAWPLVVLAAAPAALLVARLLPDTGPGLAVRLAAALAVLLVPGVLVVRALGAPAGPALAVCAALGWSLVAVAVALAAALAVNASLTLVVGVFAVLTVAAAAAAVITRRPWAPSRPDIVGALGVAAAGLAAGAAVWALAPVLAGDALEHLARTRKLAELPRYESLGAAELFADSGLHPGYAFPLWHGALALVARLAGVDSAAVLQALPALLTPVAFLAAYAAGAELFRSRAAGVATLAVQAVFWGLPLRSSGLGLLETLTGPAHGSLLILVPAVLALAFAFADRGERLLLPSLAACALALAIVHPTYALFVLVPLAALVVVRAALAPGTRAEVLRAGAATATVLGAAAAYLLWLLPHVRATRAFTPDPAEERRQLEVYADQLDLVGEGFRLAPEAVTAGGAIAVAALLAVPLAGLAAKTRWAAFVLGGSLAVLALVLVAPLFGLLSELTSVSQARRLSAFLPLPFALAGAALLAGRAGVLGAAAAAAAGAGLHLAVPGGFAYGAGKGAAPAWPVWVAVGGGAVALGLGILARRRRLLAAEPSAWTALVALAFVVPVLALSLPDLRRSSVDREALTPGLVRALRSEARPGDVVFSNPKTAYRIAAFTPLYVNVVERLHMWDRPDERLEDARLFFVPTSRATTAERLRLLSAYGADWLVVDKRRRHPRPVVERLEPVYEDGRYALYRVTTS